MKYTVQRPQVARIATVHIATMIITLLATSYGQLAFATSCTYVAIDSSTGDVVVSATGHGPRGCKRAKRRCQRRANQSCEPEGTVHTKHCSAAAQAALVGAFNFVRTHERQLMHDFKVAKRRGRRRRIRRRFSRKINRTRVGCATAVLCRTSQDKRVALHAFGIAGNKIRICYDEMLTKNLRFCDLVDTVAHEMGHSIGIKKDRAGGHSRNQNDRVYHFGHFARGLCESERVGSANYTLLP